MSVVDLSREEAQAVLRSIANCLDTCHDGGPSTGCPDCQMLESVKSKLRGLSN